MISKKTCPNCNYEIGSGSDHCPQCGFSFTDTESPAEQEFAIWEGEDRIVGREACYSDPSFRKGEICKCLGKIDEVPCNTYYRVDSIKNHGGCARRDCSNSFENDPKVNIGWGSTAPRKYKDRDSSANIFLGLVGLLVLFIGIVTESVIMAFGIVVILLAIAIPFDKEVYRNEEVNFRLVDEFEVPANARDPWIQRRILAKSEPEKSE